MPELINAQHERFCREILVDFNATQAAIRAGYYRTTAKQQGSRLLTYADIQTRLGELREVVAEKLDIEAAEVFRRWWHTATADPNELTQHRIGACRYCHGAGHAYQWKTQREYDEARAQWVAKTPAEGASPDILAAHSIQQPKMDGGLGYRLTNDPVPDCPECYGLGVPYVWMADTRRISEQARLLYNGVKETKNGIEILMADRQKALELVARNLGMLKDVGVADITGALADLVREINAKGSTAPIAEDTAP